MEWEEKVDAEGNETDEDNITVKELFKNFEEYCLPKKNLKKKILLEEST